MTNRKIKHANQALVRAGAGLVVGIVSLAFGAGCSSSTPASTTSGTGVALSGTLGTAAGASALFQLRNGLSPDVRTDFTGDSVVCATLSTPPTTATGAVNADGSFTITIVGGVNQPMNCNLVNSAGDLLASIVTSDTQHTNMNGQPTTADTLAFTASADLGAITYDPNTGEATVPVSNISESLVTENLAPSAAFDPTGNWVIGAVGFTLPDGYVGPCPAQNGGQGNNCNGPPLGQDIYLKRWDGVSTTSASTNVYGIQIWNDEGAFTACGSRIGLTGPQATALGIDFSSNGSALAAFAFASTVSVSPPGGGSPTVETISNGYQLSGAVTQYTMSTGCTSESVTVGGNSYSGYVCGADGQGYYSANIGGGCVDGSGNPVNTQGNWTPGNTPCTTKDFGGGYTEWSCSGTTTDSAHTAITCTNIGGTFTDSSLTTAVNQNTGVLTTTGTFVQNSTTLTVTGSTSALHDGLVIGNTGFVWGNGGMSSVTITGVSGQTITMSQAANQSGTGSVSFGNQFDQGFYNTHQISQGTDCSSTAAAPNGFDTSTNAGLLAQEQCFAQYYQNALGGGGGGGGSDACLRRVNSDWSTTDPTKFVEVSDFPSNLPLMNQLVYLSPTSAASRNEQDQIQGVPSSQGNGQYTNCHVHEVDSISFTSVDATHILATYTASDTTSDTGIADCVANYGDTKTKFLFTLTKQ